MSSSENLEVLLRVAQKMRMHENVLEFLVEQGCSTVEIYELLLSMTIIHREYMMLNGMEEQVRYCEGEVAACRTHFDIDANNRFGDK